jgi:hypothetical protein
MLANVGSKPLVLYVRCLLAAVQRLFFLSKPRRTVAHYIKKIGKKGLRSPNTKVSLRRPKTQKAETIHQTHTTIQRMLDLGKEGSKVGKPFSPCHFPKQSVLPY